MKYTFYSSYNLKIVKNDSTFMIHYFANVFEDLRRKSTSRRVTGKGKEVEEAEEYEDEALKLAAGTD